MRPVSQSESETTHILYPETFGIVAPVISGLGIAKSPSDWYNFQWYEVQMPEISRFFGIVVYMYWRDHEPPHFHVDYSGQKAEISIDPIGVLKGKLSPKALALVTEWAAIHQTELLSDWQLARTKQPLNRIEPLK